MPSRRRIILKRSPKPRLKIRPSRRPSRQRTWHRAKAPQQEWTPPDRRMMGRLRRLRRHPRLSKRKKRKSNSQSLSDKVSWCSFSKMLCCAKSNPKCKLSNRKANWCRKTWADWTLSRRRSLRWSANSTRIISGTRVSRPSSRLTRIRSGYFQMMTKKKSFNRMVLVNLQSRTKSTQICWRSECPQSFPKKLHQVVLKSRCKEVMRKYWPSY